MKWVGDRMAPVMGPAVLDAMLDHLIADEPWRMIVHDVRYYVQDLEEDLSFPVYFDLSEAFVGSERTLPRRGET